VLGCFIENLCHITKVKMSVPIAGIRHVVMAKKKAISRTYFKGSIDFEHTCFNVL